MLIEKNLSIEQIAQECGYNNTTFFNRKFKEKQGMTPKAYREKFKF
jgi:AraC family transcriptional regulator of arabinose operon